jgi:nucleoside-diphosphate-sugar epimerase
MKVLVAGATGALGRPVVRRLAAGGHDVVGLTRSPEKRALLEGLGARPVVVDALDQVALSHAVRDASPQAVLHLLTAIPQRGAFRASDLEATNVLRARGTANLMAAALAAGARRFVAESIALAYRPARDAPATEESALETRAPHPDFQPMLDAVASLEEQVLGASRRGVIEGVALRYGVFYGPGVGSTDFMVGLLRRRMMPLLGGGRAVLPMIHIEDAASATVAALEGGRAGEVYNVVDDQSATLREFATAVAEAVGAPRPFSLPLWVARLLGSYAAIGARMQLRVSNEKARRELGWVPAYPTVHEGAATLRA